MLKLKSVNFEQQEFQSYNLNQSYPGQTEWVIGRNTNCDLVLTSLEVSRVHGRIVYSDNTYHFVDVGSTAGSMLNSNPVPPQEKRLLHVGDMLQIGDTFLHIEELSPPSETFSGAGSGASAPFLLPEESWKEGDLRCRCCRIIQETADVKTFCFIAEPPVLFGYKPGQFVNLEVEIDGKRVLRSYSISSSPTRPYHLAITIKRVPSPSDSPAVPPGLVSNWVHNHLKVGDRVTLVGGPMGHFTCLPNLPPKMLLISAGSGITPMMSMSRWVQDTIANSDIVFLHSARTPDDIVFRAELESLATQLSNFRLAVTVTKPPIGYPWMGLTGRISKFMLHAVAPDFMERSVFVCGPGVFMEDIKSMLETMNFPMQNYQEESFGGSKKAAPKAAVAPPTKPLATTTQNGNGHHATMTPLATTVPAVPATPAMPTAPAAAPAINFSKSKQEVAADGSSSILELAEQEGISIRNACRVGACGACKVLTTQGQVQYQSAPTALSTADQQAGYVLACVAYPVDRLVVEA